MSSRRQCMRLTPELIRKISDIVRDGSTAAVACACCGVPESTRQKWFRAGEGMVRQSRHGRHRELVEAVLRAEAEATANILRGIVAAAAKSWQAAAWLLERRFPAEFGRGDRQRLELTGGDGKPLAITWQNLVKSVEEINDSTGLPEGKPDNEGGKG